MVSTKPYRVYTKGIAMSDQELNERIIRLTQALTEAVRERDIRKAPSREVARAYKLPENQARLALGYPPRPSWI